MDFLFLIVGIVIGAFVIYLFLKSKNNGIADTTSLDNKISVGIKT